MCAIMDNLIKDSIKEEKFELAREAIAEGKYTPEEVANLFKLPLSEVQEVAKEMEKESEAE